MFTVSSHTLSDFKLSPEASGQKYSVDFSCH